MSGELAPVFSLIREVTRAFRRQLEEETREYDLTLPQWRIIAKLGKVDGMNQVALANAVDIDPMTISSVLRRLGERDLVQRQPDPADARAKIVTLTKTGRSLSNTIGGLGVDLYQTAISGLSISEIEALSRGLEHIRDNLSGSDAEAKDAV